MFCSKCGSYVNVFSKTCSCCGVSFKNDLSANDLKKKSVIKSLKEKQRENESKIKVKKSKKKKNNKFKKKNKQNQKKKSKLNSKNKSKKKRKKSKKKNKKLSKNKLSLLYNYQQRNSKTKGKSKVKNSRSKPRKKNKSKKKKKSKKFQINHQIKNTTGIVDYNNGYATREGMSIFGHRLKKGSFKKRPNGEYRRNRISSTLGTTK